MKEITPELERKNLVLGWALFGIFVLLFAGTVGIAFLYVARLADAAPTAWFLESPRPGLF